MRTRLIALIPALALVLGATACHENLTPFQVCDAFKAGSTWGVVNYTFAFGVHFCRATTASGGVDEYCVFPEGDHWFYRRECDWESTAADMETVDEEEVTPDNMLTHFVPG